MNPSSFKVRSLSEDGTVCSIPEALETSLRYTKHHINAAHLHRTMRFYFNLVCDEEMMIDDEGVEVRDIEHARVQALKAIAELRQEAGSALDEWSGWRLEVMNEAGEIMFALHLNQTLH